MLQQQQYQRDKCGPGTGRNGEFDRFLGSEKQASSEGDLEVRIEVGNSAVKSQSEVNYDSTQSVVKSESAVKCKDGVEKSTANFRNVVKSQSAVKSQCFYGSRRRRRIIHIHLISPWLEGGRQLKVTPGSQSHASTLQTNQSKLDFWIKVPD